MTRAWAWGPALLAGVLLGGCAGSAPDPCANVTCAPGRVCVEGRCQGAGPSTDQYPSTDDAGSWFPDAPPSDALAPDLLAPDTLSPDTLSPDMDTGRWYQANEANCPTYCTGKGMTNVASVDGCLCVSGEARPQSAIAQGITFTWGCSSTCTAQSNITTQSYGKYCYKPGQKQDDDSTDRTVGCFCR